MNPSERSTGAKFATNSKVEVKGSVNLGKLSIWSKHIESLAYRLPLFNKPAIRRRTASNRHCTRRDKFCGTAHGAVILGIGAYGDADRNHGQGPYRVLHDFWRAWLGKDLLLMYLLRQICAECSGWRPEVGADP